MLFDIFNVFFFFFRFPLELLKRKSGSKTQTFKLQAASQSLRLLPDCEHWKLQTGAAAALL